MKNQAPSQACKDCQGLGDIYPDVDAETARYISPEFCPTCEGAGTIHRSGPYRLQDGTWSDGVDRARRIDYRDFNGRLAVWKGSYSGRWFAGYEFLTMKRYSTFEEAVAHADHLARKQIQEENNHHA